MAKCRKKGVDIPDTLDPSKRLKATLLAGQGRHLVEDGPVTNEPILLGNVPFDNMVVIEETQSFVVLEDGHAVEIGPETDSVTVVRD